MFSSDILVWLFFFLSSRLFVTCSAPGDRSHIPEAQKPIFNCLSRELARLKSTAPPGQKRMVEDTERRLNILFDALNCGTVDEKLLGGLSQLVGGEYFVVVAKAVDLQASSSRIVR